MNSKETNMFRVRYYGPKVHEDTADVHFGTLSLIRILRLLLSGLSIIYLINQIFISTLVGSISVHRKDVYNLLLINKNGRGLIIRRFYF